MWTGSLTLKSLASSKYPTWLAARAPKVDGDLSEIGSVGQVVRHRVIDQLPTHAVAHDDQRFAGRHLDLVERFEFSQQHGLDLSRRSVFLVAVLEIDEDVAEKPGDDAIDRRPGLGQHNRNQVTL